jgi:hypothetical protein
MPARADRTPSRRSLGHLTLIALLALLALVALGCGGRTSTKGPPDFKINREHAKKLDSGPTDAGTVVEWGIDDGGWWYVEAGI